MFDNLHVIHFPDWAGLSFEPVAIIAADPKTAHDKALAHVRKTYPVPAGWTMIGRITKPVAKVGMSERDMPTPVA